MQRFRHIADLTSLITIGVMPLPDQLGAIERSTAGGEVRHPSDHARHARRVRPRRSGARRSSNLLVVNGAQYVIDAGDGVTRRLTRLGTNFRNIDDIFITHPHSDHTSGLGP